MKEKLLIILNEKSTVSVYNIAGQTIKTQVLEAGTNTINVSGLSSGGYIIRIQGEKENKTFKMIKE